jgi:hypothetical protein
MVEICIIENHEGFAETKWNEETFNFYKIREEISDCITFKKINKLDDLFEILKKSMNQQNLKIHDFYYNKDYVLQAIFTECFSNLDENINYLASQLIKESYVSGNIVIIKRDINVKSHNYISVTINDIVASIQSTFLHKGIYSTAINTGEIEYINNVIEKLINKETFEQIRYHESKFLDYTLTFYVNIKAERTKENINKKCSVIYGSLIFGDVYISIYDNTDGGNVNSVDLTLEIFNMIYELILHDLRLDDPSKLQDLKIDKSKITHYINNDTNEEGHLDRNSFPSLVKHINFYYMLHNIYEQYKSKQQIISESQYINALEKSNKILNDII